MWLLVAKLLLQRGGGFAMSESENSEVEAAPSRAAAQLVEAGVFHIRSSQERACSSDPASRHARADDRFTKFQRLRSLSWLPGLLSRKWKQSVRQFRQSCF